MSRGQILIIPAVEKGRGGGHLCRCVTLACDLRALDREAWLLLPLQAGDMTGLFHSMNFNPEWRITGEEFAINNAQIEFIILDRFQTPADELARWKKIAPVIGIDEGGQSRDSFDFLVDILVPEKLICPPANIADPSLLKFPPKPLPQKPADDTLKILVSFGQEDSAGLGLAVARALSSMNSTGGMEITLLRGALAKAEETANLPNVRTMQAIPQLAEHLAEYGLVITHYGITAYEALYAGTPVLLASPTPYHAKLAKAAGFYDITRYLIFSPRSYTELHGGKKEIQTKNSVLLRGLFFSKKLKKHCEELAVRYRLREGANLAALCNSFSPRVNRRCPVCGAAVPVNSVSRFPERTYRRCSRCGVIYMDRTCPPPVEYEREYFFESYKRQYGKTYLEDFPSIKAAGKRRLKIISSLLPAATERTLLDIGCAYGPFLAAAREEGFSPAGIDPAEDAVRYVQKELSIPAVQGFFPKCPLPASPPFDAVTLWFVIEHFTDCAAVLAAIRNILKPGGILAFSTPSSSGVSGRVSIRKFLSASPADHWTVWQPSMCKKALAPLGFKVKKTVISGHHPERFPLLGKFAKSKKSPLYPPLLAISKIFKLGDTFEVYAVKNEELGIRNEE